MALRQAVPSHGMMARRGSWIPIGWLISRRVPRIRSVAMPAGTVADSRADWAFGPVGRWIGALMAWHPVMDVRTSASDRRGVVPAAASHGSEAGTVPVERGPGERRPGDRRTEANVAAGQASRADGMQRPHRVAPETSVVRIPVVSWLLRERPHFTVAQPEPVHGSPAVRGPYRQGEPAAATRQLSFSPVGGHPAASAGSAAAEAGVPAAPSSEGADGAGGSPSQAGSKALIRQRPMATSPATSLVTHAVRPGLAAESGLALPPPNRFAGPSVPLPGLAAGMRVAPPRSEEGPVLHSPTRREAKYWIETIDQIVTDRLAQMGWSNRSDEATAQREMPQPAPESTPRKARVSEGRRVYEQAESQYKERAFRLGR